LKITQTSSALIIAQVPLRVRLHFQR